MTNLTELKEDFKSHMSIEEVLIKHNISLKEAVILCNKGQSRKKKGKRFYEATEEDYISKYGKKYVIRKKVNGKTRWFGSYVTINDAVKVRDYLEANGWHHSELKSIREKLGV